MKPGLVRYLQLREASGVRLALPLVAAAMLMACGSQPPVPDWALNAEAATRKATTAYLQGQQRIEALQWQKAREAVASTGRLDEAAKLELMRCAAQVASLEWNDCPAFEPLARDATEAERAYARYLRGQVQAADIERLPAAQRAAAAASLAGAKADTAPNAVQDSVPPGAAPSTAGDGRTLQALKEVKDPLSRLLAAAVLLRTGKGSAPLLQLAVDTASEQGWSRALMAWLLLQSKTAREAGDEVTAAHALRRLDLLQHSKSQ